MQGEFRSEEERQAAIDHQIELLFQCSIDIENGDLSEDSTLNQTGPNVETPLQSARKKELAQVILNARDVLVERKAKGDGKVRDTIQETFESGAISEPVTDRFVDAIPGEEGGKMLMLTDQHGDTAALKEALRRFYDDDKTHLSVLGDIVAGGGKEQLRTLEVLLKIYSQYPDRVHLLKGNCEAAVFPHEGMSDELYEGMGIVAWRQMRGRLQDLFYQLPAMIVTENGIVATHGSLPRPKTVNGETQFSNLADINESSNYSGSILFPVYSELGQSAADKIKTELDGNKGDALMKDMLWGDIDTSTEKGYQGNRAFVSGADDLRGEMDAIGAKVLFRGHQSKLLKEHGSNVVIEENAPVATFHSSFKGDKNTAIMAEVPLDRPVDQITEDMFVGVEREN